jgi:hypothetical protein
MTTGRILAAAAAFFAALAIVGAASAQYPTPKGSLVCTGVVNGGQTSISATAIDGTGRVISGAVVSFWFVDGSGTLSSSTAVTNASGVATVTLVSSGTVTVAAGYDGLECRSVSQVLGQTFRPPSTGDGGLVGDDAASTTVFAACLLVMGVSGLALVAMRRRRVTVEER